MDTEIPSITDNDDWYSTPAVPSVTRSDAIKNLSCVSRDSPMEGVPGPLGSSTNPVSDNYKVRIYTPIYSAVNIFH